MYSVDGLELYLRRCRKVGFIGEFGMEIPYYDFEDGEIRLLPADLIAKLRGEPPLEFPDCMDDPRLRPRADTQNSPFKTARVSFHKRTLAQHRPAQDPLFFGQLPASCRWRLRSRTNHLQNAHFPPSDAYEDWF